MTRIHVIDPSLRTKDGIGVGSTYRELRARYHIAWVGSGEGGLFARVEKLAISFELDTAGGVAPWMTRNPPQVPADVRITSLMVTR